MGTAKRERQKANRQLRLEQLEKQEKRQKTKRRALQFGIIIPVAVAGLIGLIFVLGGGDDSSKGDTSATTIAATVPVPTTPATTAAPTTTLPPLPCPAEDGSSPKTQTFPSPPPMCIDTTKVYEAEVTTNKGTFTVELDPGIAPETVNNFVYLAGYHFFDETPCHRIIPSFVVQCGSPDGSGNGGPGYEFADELPADGSYQLGSLAMANSGPDTNGSQFFIITGDQGTALGPNYSLFGQVTAGFDTTVKAMEAAGTASGTPSEPIIITGVTVKVKQGAVATVTTVAPTSTVAADTTTSAG